MNISASSSLMQDYCTQERLWHISLWNTRCHLVRCWAVIKQDLIPIGSFGNDELGISMGFSRTAAFWMQDEREGEKGQTRQIRTNAHFKPRGRSRVSPLTSQPQLFVLPQRETVKINGRHQHQLPEGNKGIFEPPVRACMDQGWATIL